MNQGSFQQTGSDAGLAGRVAVVTGGTSGLGLAIAGRFLADGADVIISGRDADRGAKVAGAIGASFVQADVGDSAQCKSLIDAAVLRHGRLDILVNNAGVFEMAASEDLCDERWNQIIDTKLKGTFFCTAAALPHMRRQHWGRIINISANAKPYPAAAAYGAANGGVTRMTRSLALECAGTGITVNEIQPGFIETPATAPIADNPAMLAGIVATIPVGRIGQPDEIAGVAAFLASEGAAYVHGSSLVVDGGLSLGWTAMPRALD